MLVKGADLQDFVNYSTVYEEEWMVISLSILGHKQGPSGEGQGGQP